MGFDKSNFYYAVFNSMFFVDKFGFKNIYQCPQASSLLISVPIQKGYDGHLGFSKLLVFLYILSGQKPNIVIVKESIRGVKRKKIKSFYLTLRRSRLHSFLNFIVFRQLPLTSLTSFVFGKAQSVWTIDLLVNSQDDDVLMHILQIGLSFVYKVKLETSASTQIELKSLLNLLKIPC